MWSGAGAQPCRRSRMGDTPSGSPKWKTFELTDQWAGDVGLPQPVASLLQVYLLRYAR